MKACFAAAGIDIGTEDLEQAWAEISHHQEDRQTELDEAEMEAVSGGSSSGLPSKTLWIITRNAGYANTGRNAAAAAGHLLYAIIPPITLRKT